MRLLPLLMFLALPVMASEPAYRVIAYHDVKDSVAGDYDPDQFAVSTNNLIAQFTWLRDNGFRPVSIDQIIDAREGLRPLPENAILLTFDDGLISFYTRVFPLLKVFNYPAVVSVVTSWIETDHIVNYAGENRGRDGFVTWKQIQEMQASGLVEIASHSHDLHKGINGNPQNNLQPAAVTRLYDGESYENEAAYLDRIDADIEMSAATILKNTGRSPRVMVWPYGAFNDATAAVAAKHGMRISLTLAEESAVRSDLLHLGRYLAFANPDIGDFSSALLLPPRDQIVRVAQVDLDYVYDPDPAQQAANLDRLLDKINALEISHVFLQAFSDPDADGGADAVYFPNRHIPVRADLFNRVAWQLKTRADVKVFAWLPMLSFVGGSFEPDWRVLENRDGLIGTDPDSEPRLSPFNMEAREKIAEIYEDLATYARFDGLLFHDDGRLNEREDFSEAALDFYHQKLDVNISAQKLAADSELMRRWTRLKATTIVEFSTELVERVRRLQPGIKSARNIFAGALLDSEGPGYLAQDFDEFLGAYDYVALMAMPALEGVIDHDSFFEQLVSAVRKRPSGLERTIFELQTVDWSQPRQSRQIPSTELRATMRWLQSLGVRHLGYYPDDFITGHPDVQQLRLGMSLAEEFGSTTP
jgi:biofilm PGA synthesis lipoprotein PgaB